MPDCGTLGPGYAEACAGMSYEECLRRAGSNINYARMCMEAYADATPVPEVPRGYGGPPIGQLVALVAVPAAGAAVGYYVGGRRVGAALAGGVVTFAAWVFIATRHQR